MTTARSGSTSCNGTSDRTRTIQRGVNAADAADVVKVCPGTYVGPVTIKGARNGPGPACGHEHGTGDQGARRVRCLDHLPRDHRLGHERHGQGLQDPRRCGATSHSYCSASTGIRAIDATNVTITGNDIRPSGSGAFCGVYDGITASAGTVGTIAHNVIRDYRNNGIDVSGASTDVTREVEQRDLRARRA